MTLPDLSRVDRRVAEPKYRFVPQYCLLVFGPAADKRVWIVEDGEALYVDRNGNGDLTDPGKAISATEQRKMTISHKGKSAPYSERTYVVGDLLPRDKGARHTQCKLVRYQQGDDAPNYVLSVRVNGVKLQYAGWGPLLRPNREQASIVHFDGPVIPKLLRRRDFRLREKNPELNVCIGTPGLGNHSFAYVSHEAVPSNVLTVVEIDWPSATGPIANRFELTDRC